MAIGGLLLGNDSHFSVMLTKLLGCVLVLWLYLGTARLGTQTAPGSNSLGDHQQLVRNLRAALCL